MTTENVKAGFNEICLHNPGAMSDIAYAPAEVYTPLVPVPPPRNVHCIIPY